MNAKMLLVPVLLAAPLAMADPQCTTAAKDKWLSQSEARQKIEAMGYQIKKFETTDTNCYEIYGWDKEKHRVEIYFDPTNLKMVKEEIDE